MMGSWERLLKIEVRSLSTMDRFQFLKVIAKQNRDTKEVLVAVDFLNGSIHGLGTNRVVSPTS